MKRYPKDQDNINWAKFPFTQFKVIAKTERDKKELLSAFKHLHDSRYIDTDYVTVNQVVHLYQDTPDDPCRIVVDPSAFE